MKRIILSVVLFFGGTIALRATQTTSGDPAKPEFSASHRAAVESLFDAMSYQNTFDQSLRDGLDEGVAAHPDSAKTRAVMDEFVKRYLSFDALKPQLIDLFCDQFTENEVKEIAAFYRTPTGAKLARSWYPLGKRVAELEQRERTAHHADLEAAVKKSLEDDRPN